MLPSPSSESSSLTKLGYFSPLAQDWSREELHKSLFATYSKVIRKESPLPTATYWNVPMDSEEERFHFMLNIAADRSSAKHGELGEHKKSGLRVVWSLKGMSELFPLY